MKVWVEKKQAKNIRLLDFTGENAKEFLNYLKTEHEVPRKGEKVIGVSNKTFNNYHTNLNRVYNSLVEEGIIKKKHNPFLKIKKKKRVKTNMHVPYNKQQLKSIKEHILIKGDKQLYLFINFLYYTAGRPAKEIRLLQVKDLLPKTIFICADLSKLDAGRHSSIPPGLEDLIQEDKLRDYPPEHHVFTRDCKPGPVPVGKVYFYLRNKKVLEELKMTDKDYDLYGYKHTGNIALYEATKDLIAIKEQNGHSSLDQTYEYMVQLGQIRKDKTYSQFPKFGE